MADAVAADVGRIVLGRKRRFEPGALRRLVDFIRSEKVLILHAPGSSPSVRYQVAAVGVYSGRTSLWAATVCWVFRQAGKPYPLMLHRGDLPEFAERSQGRVRSCWPRPWR